MVYGYARVSTTEQNLDRQLKQLKEQGIDEKNIITDKVSGKNFNRTGYNLLVGTENTAPLLRKGDLLVIVSLDRLGRNYNDISKEWEKITCTLQADIKVLDMPLLDTSVTNNSLDGRFIADLVLQILSYTAEKERQNIRKRQRQGIDAMTTDEQGKRISSKTGRPVGRPTATYPANWKEVYKLWKKGAITSVVAMEQLGLKRTTFYKLVKQYEQQA